MILQTFESFLGRSFGNNIIPGNIPAIYGNLYSASSFVNTSYYTSIGNTSCSVSASTIIFGGGNAAHNSYLTLGYGYTLLNKWNASLQVRVGITGSSNNGFGFGTTSENTFNLLNFYADFNPISGALFVNGSQVATGLTAHNNDIIQLTVDLNENIASVTASNLTAGGTIQGNYTFTTAYAPSIYMANTGQFSLFALGNASYTLNNLVLSSNDYKYTKLMMIGDSKTVGYYASYPSQSYSRQVQSYYTFANIHAGGSDRTTDILLTIPEIINFAPDKVLLAIGSNDPRYGTSEPTYEANYSSISNQLLAAGIDVYYALPFPENSEDLTAQKTYIQATFPSSKIIDTWTPLVSGSHGLLAAYDAGDGVHPNQAGHSLIASTIENYFSTTFKGQYLNFSGSVIVCDGNSLTWGYGTSNPPTTSYPSDLKTLNPFATDGTTVTNTGVSGQQTSDMITRAPTYVDPLYNSSVTSIVVAWEMGNDIYYNGDVAGAETRWTTYCNGRKATGFKIVSVTSPARNHSVTNGGFSAFGDSDAVYNVKREECNNWLRANYTSFSDALLDLDANANLATYNTTYFYSDQVHLNETGYLLVSELCQAVLLSMKA